MTEKLNFIEFMNDRMGRLCPNAFLTLIFKTSRFRKPSAEQKLQLEIWMETDPENEGGWTRVPSNEYDCLVQWFSEDPGGSDFGSYFCLEEPQGEDCRFHVLLCDWDGDEAAALRRWHEISGGSGFTRELDHRVRGLIGHMVMRKGYELTMRDRWGFQRFTREDFVPWREKTY